MTTNLRGLDAHGVTIRAEIEHPDTRRLFSLAFRNFAPGQGGPALDVTATRGAAMSLPASLRDATQLGSGVTIAADEIHFRHEWQSCHARLDRAEEVLHVRSAWRSRADRRLRARIPMLQTRWEEALHELRAAVYLPWFWMLAEYRGVLALHAAAVEWRGRTVLIAGLNGSGKSTFADRLRAIGGVLLADNYSLVTPAGDLLPLPEFERHARARRSGADEAFHAFGKEFTPPPLVAMSPRPISGVFIMARSGVASLSRLPQPAAMRSLDALQALTPEFVEDTPLSLLGRSPLWSGGGDDWTTPRERWRGMLQRSLGEVPMFGTSLPLATLGDEGTLTSLMIDALDGSTHG